MDIKNSNFVKSLMATDSNIKLRRAAVVAASVSNEFETTIRIIKNEIDKLLLETSINDDMGAETTMSLVVGKDVNAKDYVTTILDDKKKLRVLKFKLVDSLEAFVERFGFEYVKSLGFDELLSKFNLTEVTEA
jgi:hypothetical protein